MEENDIFSLAEESEKNFPVSGMPGEYISVALRPSSSDFVVKTKSPTVSYIKLGYGIPLEIRVNKYESYSRVVLKTDLGVLPSYKKFATDIYGNIAQDKVLKTTEMAEIKKELEKLLF